MHPWNSQRFVRGARKAGRTQVIIDNAIAVAASIKSVDPDLPVIFTLEHLANLTEVPSDELRRIVLRKMDPYRVFRVKKRTPPGGIAPTRAYRTICVPNSALMTVQRWLAQNVLALGKVHSASFAFARKSSIVEAAHRHCGCRWLVKLDVQRFFESLSEKQAYKAFREFGYGSLLSFEMARLCTRIDPRARARKSVWIPPMPYGVLEYS
jgi:RNA-directed DNA polymerase